MNFDFDNFEQYLDPEPTPEMVSKIGKINSIILNTKLNDYDATFIVDIKRRILDNRKLTEKQKNYLARLLKSAADGSYDCAKKKPGRGPAINR